MYLSCAECGHTSSARARENSDGNCPACGSSEFLDDDDMGDGDDDESDE